MKENKLDWTDELLPKKEQASIVRDNYKRGWDVVKANQPKWDENYETYRTHFRMPDDQNMSELGIPLVFADIESYMPRIAANKPEIGVWPRAEDDRDRAGKQRLLVDYQWDALRMPLKMVDYAKNGKIYGTAIWKVSYKKEVRNRLARTVQKEPMTMLGGMLTIPGMFNEVNVVTMTPQTVWDDPWIDLLDLDEVIPDPDGWDVESCNWIIHEKPIDLEDIIASVEAGEDIYVESVVRELLQKAKEGNPEENPADKMEDNRKATFGQMLVSVDPHKRRVHELECWYDGKVVSVIKEYPDLDPIQYRPNPLGFKPFIRFCPIPLPKEFYGIALTEVLFSLAVELNILHSARLDNLLYAAHRMFKVMRTSNISPQQLRFRPGGVLYVDDMRDIEEMQTAPMDFSLYRESDEVRMWAQRAGGATDTFQGLASNLTGGTATEANLLAQASGSRAGLMFKLLTDGPLYDWGRMMVILNEVYMSEEKQIRVSGGKFQEDAFETIAPEDLANRTGLDLDVKIDVATTEPESRQVKLQRSNAALQTYGSIGLPLQHPLMERILLDMAESFGFDDASAMILEGRQIIEQQQQAALMAEQEVAPGEAGVAGSEAEMMAAQLGAEAPQ
jgi:hypothetical protein